MIQMTQLFSIIVSLHDFVAEEKFFPVSGS